MDFHPTIAKEDLIYPIANPPLIKPRRLHHGAIIGLVAPASPFETDAFEAGVAMLGKMGFQPRPAPGIFNRQGYLAGDDAHRATQLIDAWTDEKLDALMCARGGFGSLRLLPYLDMNRMAARPIPFIGFSDISAILQQLIFRAGLVAFHGPTVCTLGRADHQTRDDFLRTLSQNEPLSLVAEDPQVVRSGSAQGVLVGGNLTTLCHLLGTPFTDTYTNCILFLEDTGEAPYRIERMLVQMKMAGCFQGMAGLVLGTFNGCGSAHDITRIVIEVFGDMDIPILASFPAGHTDRNMTLPLGVRVALDTDNGALNLLESPTTD